MTEKQLLILWRLPMKTEQKAQQELAFDASKVLCLLDVGKHRHPVNIDIH